MSKITYQNKVASNENPSVADINKVKASDMNEIKNVVNANDDKLNEINDKLNEINDKFNYSTSEQRIGTWIDGKPIYRKVVIRNQNITNGDTVDLSSLNIDELIHIGSRHKLNNFVFMFNSFDSSSNKVTIHQNNNTLEVWTGIGVTYYSTIWIEYTKTTD